MRKKSRPVSDSLRALATTVAMVMKSFPFLGSGQENENHIFSKVSSCEYETELESVSEMHSSMHVDGVLEKFLMGCPTLVGRRINHHL